MDREYIKINKPSPLPNYNNHLRELHDDLWKKWVFYHLLSFYRNCNKADLNQIIQLEKIKEYPRTEREIAKFIRNYLRNDRLFDLNFGVFGEVTNDEDFEGSYDIVVNNTYWKNEFHFECKNLDTSQGLINKYVYCKIYPKGKSPKMDGGIYRYFNGKYAQNQNFGGMIGFVLNGDIQSIKTKIIDKIESPFDNSPEGDLKYTLDNSIMQNDFTFDSIHSRFDIDFTLHHLLLDFTS
jgi:hypothetical protein